MGRLQQNFLNHSRAWDVRSRVSRDILSGLQHGTSNFESFNYVAGVPCAHLTTRASLPNRELLHKPRARELASVTGGSVEDFYKLCHRLGLDEAVDKVILKKLLPESLKHEEGVSMNLCSRTAYSKNLPAILDEIEHDPRKVMFEISESKIQGHGRIPAEYNPRAIDALKKQGYRFAMDDVALENPDEWYELSIFEAVDAIKFPHETAALMRTGDSQTVDKLTHHIWAISRLCPDAILIMEGVRSTDHALMKMLADAGVHAYQKSSYGDPAPSTDLELIP